MSTWAKNKAILRDQAVDDAHERAKTDLLYKKYLEREHEKWKQQEIVLGPRPTIKDANPYESKQEENAQSTSNPDVATVLENVNQDYDSLDELEKEILGDDEEDKELAKIQQKKKRGSQEEMERETTTNGTGSRWI